MFETPTLDTLAAYNINVALPAIALLIAAMVVLLVDLFLSEERRVTWTPSLALAGVTVSVILTLLNYNPSNPYTFAGMFVADSFTAFLNLTILGCAFITILITTDYLRRTNMQRGEFYVLLMLSSAGTMFMVGANDLIVVFVSLELLSIPLYVMAAFRVVSGIRAEATWRSEESGIKYFILGAFSSAFLVYGSALIYGATGTTNLNKIFAAVPGVLASTNGTPTFLLLAGAALALVGLGFKVAAVPFHMWTPDVYEGAPTPATAFMSVVAKVGGFAALIRVMTVGLSAFVLIDGYAAAWQNAIEVVAVATLLLGNFVAVSQTNIKRMLAYSSIAHAGYLMMAVAAVASEPIAPGVANQAVQSLGVYLMAYMFTNLGAFGVVMALEKDDGTPVTITDFTGLATSRPLLAAAMAVFMMSLIGIPLTGGFMGKWLIFGAAVHGGLILLAVVAVLTSVVSAFYYMRVVMNMYLYVEKDQAATATPGDSRALNVAIYASAVGVLIMGIVVPVITLLINNVHLL
jgi:NADH-quinone oxidoreductase subunit N